MSTSNKCTKSFGPAHLIMKVKTLDNEDHEGPPGRGYLLVAGIDPIQISPDGINPECHRLFLRILGRRLLMRASAHSTAWVSTMVLVVRTSAFCDTRFGWCSHTLALWRSAEAYESSSSPFGSFWSAFMFWRSAMTSCSQYPLFWDGISQAPSVPEVRVRPGATIPTQLTSVQLLMWRKRSTFLFASVSSEMCHLPVCIFLWWWWGIFGHSNGRFWSSSTCCSLDDVYIHILYRQWCMGKRFAPGLCVLLPDDPPVWELLREHLFSTRPLSWLSVVWTCCYGAGLLDAAQVPQCGGLWTLLPLLQSDHRLHYSLSATTRGWMVPTFFVVFVLKKLQWRWWTCI